MQKLKLFLNHGLNVSFFYAEFTPSSTERSPSLPPQQSKANVIAGSVAVALFLLFFILVTYCIYKRRKQRKKRKINKGFAGVNFTAVSMRDRIRAESMRALDESNVLNLFNPDDITQLPLSTIEYVRDLGSGNFGLVFLGESCGVVLLGYLFCYLVNKM